MKGEIKVPMQEEIQKIADYVGLKGTEKRRKREVKRLLAARKKARTKNARKKQIKPF